MPKMPVVTPKELAKLLGRMGFVLYHQVGSHAQFKDVRGRRITVSLHAGKAIGRKTLKGIINDLDMTVEEFIALL